MVAVPVAAAALAVVELVTWRGVYQIIASFITETKIHVHLSPSFVL